MSMTRNSLRRRRRQRLSLATCVLSVIAFPADAFAPVEIRESSCARSRSQHQSSLNSKLFGPEDDFDQEIGRNGPLDTDGGGSNLAKDFFNEMKRRERDVAPSEQMGELANGTISQEVDSVSNTSPDDSEIGDFDPYLATKSPLPKRKFTGQRESFYSQRTSGQTSGNGQARTPREMMMEREYQLVDRAERGIAVQAVIAAIALAFYIYIGISGGIVSGRDAQMENFGADDEIPFEQLMPVQRDREISVWL